MNSFIFFHWYPLLFSPTHQVTMNTEDVCLSGCGQHFARPDPGMFKVDHRLYELSRQMKRFHSFLSHDWSTSRWMKLMSLGIGKGIGLERVDITQFGTRGYYSTRCGTRFKIQGFYRFHHFYSMVSKVSKVFTIPMVSKVLYGLGFM